MGTFTAVGADEGVCKGDIPGYTEAVAEKASLGGTVASCPGPAKDGPAAERAVSGVG
mgnify:CR=1 FL=1